MWKLLLPLLSVGSSLALAAAPATRDSTDARFVDAGTYFANQARDNLAPVTDMTAVAKDLAKQFDAICGDTFCAGDYSDLTAHGLDCSVALEDGTVGACQWSFTGSYSSSDPATGAAVAHTKVFHCDLGVVGTASDLANFLDLAQAPGVSGYEGLTSATVPGTTESLYDKLTHCL